MTAKIWKARIKTIGKDGNTSGLDDGYLKMNKWYPVLRFIYEIDTDVWGRSFDIQSERGQTIYCLERLCAHLSGGNWELKEFDDDDDNNDDSDD